MTPTPTQALEPVEVTQADTVLFLEHAFRNIDLPPLSHADVKDIRDGLARTIERHRQSSNAASVGVDALRRAIPLCGPLTRQLGPDYELISAPGFELMTQNPDIMVGLFEALPDILASLQRLEAEYEEDALREALEEIRQIEPEELWDIPDRYSGERPSHQTLDAAEVFAIIDRALSATPAPTVDDRLREALRLARPIVECDLSDAIEHCDADWEGLSRTALEAIDAALSDDAEEVKTARFGHHPDPAFDFCHEVECCENDAYDLRTSTADADRRKLLDRIDRALSFRVGGDEGCVSAKQSLRALESAILDGRCREYIDGVIATRAALSDRPQAEGERK